MVAQFTFRVAKGDQQRFSDRLDSRLDPVRFDKIHHSFDWRSRSAIAKQAKALVECPGAQGSRAGAWFYRII